MQVLHLIAELLVTGVVVVGIGAAVVCVFRRCLDVIGWVECFFAARRDRQRNAAITKWYAEEEARREEERLVAWAKSDEYAKLMAEKDADDKAEAAYWAEVAREEDRYEAEYEARYDAMS